MSTIIRQLLKLRSKITTVPCQPNQPQDLTQGNQSSSLLELLASIMGKVRKHIRTVGLKTLSQNDPPSPTRKSKKSVGEKLVGKQNVTFKAKSVNETEIPSSSKGLSSKEKKIKLEYGIIHGALQDKISMEGTSRAEEKQVKLVSAHSIPKTRSPKEKKDKRRREGEEQLLERLHKRLSKMSVKIVDDVPLAFEMPKVIDDSALSKLNSTLGEDMDTKEISSDSDSIPLLVSDPQFSNSKADIVDIPLAVVMPVHTSSRQSTEKTGQEKQLAFKENTNIIPLKNEKDKPNSSDNFSTHQELEEPSASLGNTNSIETSFRKEPSERDKVLKYIKVHLIGSSVVLQLVHPVRFFIFGQVKVQVLQGKIEILGYEMDSKSGSHVVSSLRGSSFLSIKTASPEESDGSLHVPSDLQDRDVLKSHIEAQNSNNVWILFKEGNQDFLEYIQMYLEYPVSVKEFRQDENSTLSQAQEALSCIIQPEQLLGKRINESEAWKNISHKITKEYKSCTVLCGGKGVGKSTLLRYLINQILSSGEAEEGVVVLDFDPGQAELTPPGCVAVSLIKKPLLGPNYTHLQPPEKCIFIGEISVMQCLGRYIEASADLIRFYRESPQISSLPCIVNTMGFTKGIGVTIMGQLLELLRPTRVVQIESRRRRDNYPFHLTSKSVLSHLKSSDSRCIGESLRLFPSEKGNLHYEFILLQSAAEAKSSKDENVWGMKPKVSRNAVILSYFSSLVQPPFYSILDNIPYSCPLRLLFLCVAHEQVPPDLVLATLNANLVALCCINPQTSDVLYHHNPDMPRVLTKVPIAPCIGFGIVRGVDMHAKMLYLSTPLSVDKLSMINCLIYGAVNLPPSVNIKTTAPGLVPYVSTGHHPELST